VIGGPRVRRDLPLGDPVDIARRAAALEAPVLVACDVDGTLSEIAPTPAEARLEAGALAALRAVTARDIAVLVVSGRSVGELRHQFGLHTAAAPGRSAGLLLIGSHGAEIDGELTLDPVEAARLASVRNHLEGLAAPVVGALVEVKPCAIALHVRQVEPPADARLLAMVVERYAREASVTLLEGKQVIEVAVRQVTKRSVIEQIRGLLRPTSVLFAGDDASDEAVFESLGPRDLAVRVGSGETCADCRLAVPADLVRMLDEFAVLWA
jgi:trehalose-phosphatase